MSVRGGGETSRCMGVRLVRPWSFVTPESDRSSQSPVRLCKDMQFSEENDSSVEAAVWVQKMSIKGQCYLKSPGLGKALGF